MIDLARATPPPGFDRPGLQLAAQPAYRVAIVRVCGEGDHGLAAALGQALPARGRAVAAGERGMIAWLAPGEWLLAGDGDAAAALIAAAGAALADGPALVTDLTHGRAVYSLTGARARDALAAHCPLDLSERAFAPGDVARSLFGDVGLFVGRQADVGGAPCFMLIVDQTAAPHLTRLLAAGLA